MEAKSVHTLLRDRTRQEIIRFLAGSSSFASSIFTRAARIGFLFTSFRMIGSHGFGLMSFLALSISSSVTDVKRKPILAALVKILEANDELPARELKTWIESIKI